MSQCPVRMVSARAPVRLDLAGGWTDVPPFSSEVGGAVVNAAIGHYARARLASRADSAIRIVSEDYGIQVEAPDAGRLVYDGRLDLIKAAIRRLDPGIGLEMAIRCDAPPGSGTGSSAAVAVAALGALNGLRPSPLSRTDLAELAHRLETDEIGVAGGRQDQYAAALGGVNFLRFRDPVAWAEPLALPERFLAELDGRLVLCYTGHSRISGDIISAVMGAYRKGVPQTVSALRRLKAIAEEMRAALLAGDLSRFGQLLGENWQRQRELHPSVTNDALESLFTLAMSAGAVGGKALGAGGGGCLLFFCAAGRVGEVVAALTARGVRIMPFRFDFCGLALGDEGDFCC